MADLVLTGDIDRSAEELLMTGYADAVRDGADAVTLDFGAVDYVNSTGIALIVGLLARARADGVRVSARGLSDHYREIFEITRLADFMHIIDEGDSHA
jgi:anti-sigma B factor antagonist